MPCQHGAELPDDRQRFVVIKFVKKLLAVVVAQAVEQWLSVQAGRVRILGQTLACFGSDCCSILVGHWAFSVYEVIDQTMSDTPILLSVSYPD